MEIIGGPRRSGRTTELIRRSAEDEEQRVNYIIVHSQQAAQAVFAEAKKLGKNIGFPVTVDEIRAGHYAGENINHFYIDNLELMLSAFTGFIVPVKAATIRIDTLMLPQSISLTREDI